MVYRAEVQQIDSQGKGGTRDEHLRWQAPIHGLYDRRYDLNADGRINVLDLMAYRPVFGMSCTNP